jgi:hypothetical protein
MWPWKMRSFAGVVVLLGAQSAAPAALVEGNTAVNAVATQVRPNVVLIMVDDMRKDDLRSCLRPDASSAIGA